MAGQGAAEKIDPEVLKIATTVSLDAALTSMAAQYLNSEDPNGAGPTPSKTTQDDIQNTAKSDLKKLGEQQLKDSKPVDEATAKSALAIPASVREAFDKIDAISHDAGQTFLAVNALFKETDGKKEDSSVNGIGGRTANLMSYQINDAIIQHSGDDTIAKAVEALIGEGGAEKAKKFAEDYQAAKAQNFQDQQSVKMLFIEAGDIGMKAMTAAAQAIEAGISGGSAQVTKPEMPVGGAGKNGRRQGAAVGS